SEVFGYERRERLGLLDVCQVSGVNDRLRCPDGPSYVLGVLRRAHRVLRARDDERRRLDPRELVPKVPGSERFAAGCVYLSRCRDELLAESCDDLRALGLGEPAADDRVGDRLQTLLTNECSPLQPLLGLAEARRRAREDEAFD